MLGRQGTSHTTGGRRLRRAHTHPRQSQLTLTGEETVRTHTTGRAALLRILAQGGDLGTRQPVLAVGDSHDLRRVAGRGHAQGDEAVVLGKLDACDTAAGASLRADLRRVEGQ